jgi:hypothetical protein
LRIGSVAVGFAAPALARYAAAVNQTNAGNWQRIYEGENRMGEAYNTAGVRVSWYV